MSSICQEKSTEIVVHAYDWVTDDKVEEDHVAIHAWCLDRNSEPYLLRFTDFPAFCHVELPIFINGRPIRWTNQLADRFTEWLSGVLKDDAPEKSLFKMARKIYYYRGNRKFPMVLLTFKTLRAMQHCEAVLSKPHRIEEFNGIVACRVWETSIGIVRKLLTLRKCRYSQWFKINGWKVPDDDKISTLENEYIVNWRTLDPISNDQTKGWTTHPRMLAFDIECYSDNHKAMPSKNAALHVAYMISLIYQRVGDPKTRKRYAIILGDCDDITLPETRPSSKPGDPDEKVPGDLNVEVIRVNTEIELIDQMSQLVKELDPEILTGYNILGFDYPYLDARLRRRLHEWKPMGRLLGKLPIMTTKTWKSDAYGYNEINIMNIDGRISIDLLPLIKRDYKLDKYNLDFVAPYFLGEGRCKHDIKAPEMFRIFENMKQTYDEYKKVAEKYNLPLTFSQLFKQPNSLKTEFERVLRFAKNPLPPEELKIIVEFLKTWQSVPVDPDENDVNALFKYRQSMENMTRVMKYCIQDSELVVDLFEKLNVWIGLVELSNIVGVTVMELFTRGQQIRCLSQIYDLAAQREYVLDKRDIIPVKFSGGFVYEPIPGLYDNIICLDFASLYPSIIRAYNICFTTLVPPELEDEIPNSQCNVIEFDQEETGDINEDNKESDDDDHDHEEEEEEKNETKPKTKVVHRRYKFVKNEVQPGLLPELVKKLVEERKAVRNLLDGVRDKNTGEWIIPKEKDPIIRTILDKRQLALKVTANSFFGFLGVQNGGKMPLIEGAMAITAKGRELINTVNQHLREKHAGTIVYGDSVTEDTPLLIRYNGLIYYRRICDLVTFTDQDQRPDGKEERNIIGYEVWSDQGWTPIKRVIRHRTTKQIYRILTHTGCVDVTEDHSMLRPNGTEVSPTDLSVGDKLLHSKLPLLENPVHEHITIESEDSLTVEEEIAWVFGVFYAKGNCDLYKCSNEDKSSWTICNQDIKILERAKRILEKMHPYYEFKIENYTICTNWCKLQAYGQHIVDLCVYYRNMFYTGVSDLDPSNNYKIVPDNILNAPINIKRAFLTGYYAGDRHHDLTKWNNKGKIGTAGLYYVGKSIGYKMSLNSRIHKLDVFTCTATFSNQRKDPTKIKKIIPLGSSDRYVYDLETENHHFSAGIGELVVHNTDSCMVDLHIKDSKLCNEWGERLSLEISGNPEKGIPGLFPPPLRMEFEKAMKLLCIKKKKYAAALIDKDGNHKLAEKDILKKGIVLARRDNCKWLRKVYMKVLLNILTSKPIDETFDIIVDSVIDFLDGKVSYKDLIIIKELGANYKSPTFSMKVFADQLRKLGKQANPGDRLEYVIVDTGNPDDKLGMKMRLPEMYLESQQSDKPEHIDSLYYLEHVLMNPIDQLFQTGYKKELQAMENLIYKPKGKGKWSKTDIHICKPVQMMIRMIMDKQDIQIAKRMLRNPDLYSQPHLKLKFSLYHQIPTQTSQQNHSQTSQQNQFQTSQQNQSQTSQQNHSQTSQQNQSQTSQQNQFQTSQQNQFQTSQQNQFQTSQQNQLQTSQQNQSQTSQQTLPLTQRLTIPQSYQTIKLKILRDTIIKLE